MICHTQSRFVAARLALIAAGASLFSAAASAGITPVGPGSFGVGTTTITFDEHPVGTATPFVIGVASFGGLGGIISTFTPGLGMPPGPSGSPVLYTGSVGNEDMIEVLFSVPQVRVGAYFNIFGDLILSGIMQMEFYHGATLLGIVPATPDPGTWGGFVGGDAGAQIIDRVIFRDIDTANPVSFRIDDLMFIPAPGAAALLVPLLAASYRRRR